MNQPKVSVIMAVYNTERYLRQSIQSVIEQTYGNWELIVVDDVERHLRRHGTSGSAHRRCP